MGAQRPALQGRRCYFPMHVPLTTQTICSIIFADVNTSVTSGPPRPPKLYRSSVFRLSPPPALFSTNRASSVRILGPLRPYPGPQNLSRAQRFMSQNQTTIEQALEELKDIPPEVD